MAISSQLQSLSLRPYLNLAEAPLETVSPCACAEAEARLSDDLIEEPHVDEVEELREELDGESRVHSTATQQRHCVR